LGKKSPPPRSKFNDGFAVFNRSDRRALEAIDSLTLSTRGALEQAQRCRKAGYRYVLQSIPAPRIRHYILLTIFCSQTASTEIWTSADKAGDRPRRRTELTGCRLRPCNAASAPQHHTIDRMPRPSAAPRWRGSNGIVNANCVGASDAEAADGRDVSSEKLMRVAFASLPLATSICAARLADRCGSP
jgi:hypothetical protein